MSTGHSSRAVRRRLLPRLRDARIRAKLTGLMVVPLAAVLVLGAARLIEVRGTASDSNRVAELTRLSTGLANLTRLLQVERMAAVAYLVDRGADSAEYEKRIDEVDAQIEVFRADRAGISDVPDRVADRFSLIDERLGKLARTRTDVAGRVDVTVASAVSRYGDVLNGLAGFEEAVGQIAEPGPVADALRSLGAFSRIEAAVSQQEAVAYSVRITGELSSVRQQQLIAAQASRDAAFADFRALAATNQVGLVEAMLADAKMGAADGLSTRLTGRGAAKLAEILKAYEGVLQLLRVTERQLEDRALAVAEDDSAGATRRAVIEAGVVLLVLLIAVLFAVILARDLNYAARRLREGALTVAERDLPDAVRRLQDIGSVDNGGAERIIAETRDPIRLTGHDEFGQVAEALNVVHREAVRIAAEQAALRTSVSAMFLSLARRSQRLVDRMIGQIDQIERTEEDPGRLAKLFELDHLAIRMRRNDENLLVLAGAEAGAPRREDAPLLDALRAAQSEVEQYHRIEFGTVDAGVSVAAAAVSDVVRLVAELLDNATRFSPPTTQVMAHGQRVRDHVIVQIEDRGLGVAAEQLALINRRLAEPAEVDVTTFRLMGFAVVARLAQRHGVRVRLHPGREGGTVAEVVLPPSVVVLPAVPAARTPIRVDMRQAWFDPAASAPEVRGMPTAGYAPGTNATRWRTAADEGWQRATAAAAPRDNGITPTGLPKRIPQAQLVPGEIPQTPGVQHRRNFDAVRGLLSAYTRGVQRGRSDGLFENATAARHAAKENDL